MRMFWPSQRLDCLTTRYKHIKWHHRLWHLLQHHIAVILTPGEEAREGWHGVRGNSKSSKVRKHGRYFNVHVWNIWKLDSFTCNVGNFSAWKLNRWTDHYFRFYENLPNLFCFFYFFFLLKIKYNHKHCLNVRSYLDHSIAAKCWGYYCWRW